MTSGSKTSFNRDRKNLWRTEQDSGRGAAGYVCGNADGIAFHASNVRKRQYKKSTGIRRCLSENCHESNRRNSAKHDFGRTMVLERWGLEVPFAARRMRAWHMRENHCITEIIDENGNVLPDGKWGELVITTIGMEAQPLIRYRTGDWSRIIPGRCLCGSEIKRLDFVKRMDPLGSIREMDELLFEIPELVDYCVKIVDGKKEITALFTSDNGEERIRSVLEEKDIRSWNCKKAKWEDGALYPGKRVTRQ